MSFQQGITTQSKPDNTKEISLREILLTDYRVLDEGFCLNIISDIEERNFFWPKLMERFLDPLLSLAFFTPSLPEGADP